MDTNGKAEKLKTGTAWRKSIGSFIHFAVRKNGMLIFQKYSVFKNFFDTDLMLPRLGISKAHREFWFVNSTTRAFPFHRYGASIFAIEKYTKFFKWTKIMLNVPPIIAGGSALPRHYTKILKGASSCLKTAACGQVLLL
jgi:hypothetical protein